MPSKSSIRSLVIRTTIAVLIGVALIVYFSDKRINAGPAIPQDAALIESLNCDLLAWHRESVAAYDTIGSRNDKWDAPARESIDLLAKWFSKVCDPEVELAEVYAAASRAIDAGCDDPMVLYVYARSSAGKNMPDEPELRRRYQRATEALEASEYSADRKYRAWVGYANNLIVGQGKRPPEVVDGIRHAVDRAMYWMIESAKSSKYQRQLRDDWYYIAQELFRALRVSDLERQEAMDTLNRNFCDSAELSATCDLLRARILIEDGWNARTGEDARAVRADQWRVFIEKLSEARGLLEEVWERQPGNYQAASMMVQIDCGIGGDREEMEMWFDRGMKANPNGLGLCQYKMQWLAPQWHGSYEEYMAFARACVETKNWHSRITLLIADAHHGIACHHSRGGPSAYFAQDDVWEEIQAVYEEYLSHHPGDFYERSEFAGYCMLCGKKEEAARQFRILGDTLVYSQKFPEAIMKDAKRRVLGEPQELNHKKK